MGVGEMYFKSPTMSESSPIRFCCYFLFYFAQGTPIGLWALAIPTWLAVNGASPGEIGGFVGLVMLPWAVFKLFYGAFMDRYTYAAMGRRRAWLIGGQSLAVISLVPLAILQPGTDELVFLGIFAFAMNIGLTMQDTAVDGIAVELTPEDQRGRANGIMFAGQIIGTGVSAGIAGLLLKYYGIGAVALCFGAFLTIVLAVAILVRERPGERMLPWTSGTASAECLNLQHVSWLPVFKGLKSAFFQWRMVFFILAFLATGIVQASMDVGGAVYSVDILHWDETGFSSLAGTAGIVAGFVGMLLLGFATDRIGVGRVLVICLVSLSLFSIFMATSSSVHGNETIFRTFVFFYFIAVQALVIGFAALAMKVCLESISASQFSILVALPNMARSTSSSLMGFVHDIGGISGFWFVIAAACGFSLIAFAAFTKLNAAAGQGA